MFRVAAGSYSQFPGTGWQAISSTASSLIGGPQSVIDQLATALFPCRTLFYN